MITLTPRVSHIHRTLLIIGLVCLTALCAGLIFVSAHNDNNSHSTTSTPDSAPADAATRTKIAKRFGQLPLSFEINDGQIDPAVKFLSHGPGYDLFLTANEAVLTLQKPQEPTIEKFKRLAHRGAGVDANAPEGSVLRLMMIGANTMPQVEGQDELPGKVNYFSGNNPEKWRRNVPTYRKVHFKDVYPGIDMVYYGNQRELEYDFVVAPGANPKVIKF